MKNNKESMYLRERAYLRELAQRVAKESPHLSDFLTLSHDPGIERVFEAFALLIARLRDKIEDDFPEITHGILSRIWPSALSPVPPTTVMQFHPTDGEHQGTVDIPAGTPVSADVNGQLLTFKTCRSLHIEPLIVRDRTVKKTGTHSEIVLTLCQTGTPSPVWQSGSLSFFLGTDNERAAQLSLWLDQHICDMHLRTQGEQRKLNSFPYGWHNLFDALLLPMGNRTYAGLQLLLEYYALPHLYNFMTVDISDSCRDVPLNADGSFELVFRFEGELPLDNVDDAFMLGCVPAIHLETLTSLPLPLNEGNHRYPLLLGESVQLFRLRDIQVVQQPDETQQRGSPCRYLPIDQFTPSSPSLAEDGEPETLYYLLQNERDLLGRLTHQLHFFDLTGKPAQHLPALSVVGDILGYHTQAITLKPGEITLTQEGSPAHLNVHNILPVSADYPSLLQDNSGWPLLSCLSSPPVLLFATDSLKQFLRLFDPYPELNRPLSRHIRRHIDGIVRVEEHLTDRMKRGRPVRGHRVGLTLNPDCYHNPGEMYRFCRLIHEAMACFISQSTFVRLEVYTPDTRGALWVFKEVYGARREM
ncbi:type VI secretion system baseplate subunit TssF [Xenorhabdus nematophila]|uniref:type VI secretion system baseplate subunit TssF n=1 Tax=Xenorhabdus nematophila TaxID=628 RepID=UPI00054417F4|nr:type VI secretion system baseplate subunit TssF [Xenorhabdus nematophila]CEF29565.1 putative Type VI secretion protein [Xenorhabdus nematophila str. Websteri]AYA39155.1 type VI secretion system baseplate subunit TssF [Xenorhabdus nematophila]KHD27446.1 type VI secretion protein [Xenorhabdus nematophila]MBA0017737.1 type VI secretion system baseplate subunit TssF [Xenorhabdus nematophila]MCB4426481.1 type VI secretion system baseplate subunit TssF [Xenorhabdus nematophila]